MIVRQDISWIRMLFTVRGTGLNRSFPRIAVITLFSVLVTYFERYTKVAEYSLTSTPFVMIGLALGIFLGFRNNAAYDRFWEGRKLWGGLVNSTRSFARRTRMLVRTDPGDAANVAEVTHVQRSLVFQTIAFVHALRCALRDSDPLPELQRLLPEPQRDCLRGKGNVPQEILLQIGLELRQAWQRGWISDFHLPVLEESLQAFTDIQGACERIKNTPFPFPYSVLLHQIVAFYCFFLTFGILEQVGLMTPVVVMLISHAFLGLDEIGEEIEDPFGTNPNHLPLTNLSQTIERNLRQLLGEAELPPSPLPADGVVS